MPNKISNKNDDKTYHAQMKRLEKQLCKLERRLNSLCQREKAIQSIPTKKIIRDKIKILEREIVEKVVEMKRLEEAWKRENYRRKHCKIKSCPISPLQELFHALQKNTSH